MRSINHWEPREERNHPPSWVMLRVLLDMALSNVLPHGDGSGLIWSHPLVPVPGISTGLDQRGWGAEGGGPQCCYY